MDLSNSKKPNPKVSVIVPSYNHAPFLLKRLNSIKSQTYRNFEILLLDDGSKDNSVEILEQFQQSEKRVVHADFSTENTGQTNAQWLKGVAKAQGEYVWIAESDDVAEPEFLATLLEQFAFNNEIALTYCDSLMIDEKGNAMGPYDYSSQNFKNIWDHSFVIEGRQLIRDYLVFANVIPNVSAVLFKKESLKQALVANDFKYCGDWSCYIRLALKNDIAFVNQKLNQFRHHINTTRNHDVKSYTVALHERISLLRLIRDSGIKNSAENIRISLSQIRSSRNKKRRVLHLINKLDKAYQHKNTLLYGYNDITRIVMKQSTDKRNIIAIADQKTTLPFNAGVPILQIQSIDFSQIELVVICSLLHTKTMTEALKKYGYQGAILAV